MRYLFILFALVLAGCASKTIPASKSFQNEANGLSVEVNWIKNKGDAMDLSLTIKNEYPHPVVVQEDSVMLEFVGRDPSRVIKSNPRWVVRPGNIKTAVVLFGYEPEVPEQGKGTLWVKNIFKSQEADIKNTDQKAGKLPDVKGEFGI
jgi:hypothetical protein